MADDDKDRLGEKLRRKEKAEEDRFFAERDQKLLERLRRQKSAEQPEEGASPRLRCPRCGAELVTVPHHGTTGAECPAGHGMWLDHADLEGLAAGERDSWLGRFFHRPRR